jgi:hypothetical protein
VRVLKEENYSNNALLPLAEYPLLQGTSRILQVEHKEINYWGKKLHSENNQLNGLLWRI